MAKAFFKNKKKISLKRKKKKEKKEKKKKKKSFSITETGAPGTPHSHSLIHNRKRDSQDTRIRENKRSKNEAKTKETEF